MYQVKVGLIQTLPYCHIVQFHDTTAGCNTNEQFGCYSLPSSTFDSLSYIWVPWLHIEWIFLRYEYYGAILKLCIPHTFCCLFLSSGQPKGVCVSPGGRFPAFSSEGKPPGRAPKGRRDLALCRIFRQNTCCDVTQTFPALISVRNLALTGEGSQECIHLWELLECSICDPRVGVRPGPPAICASFCDMVFKACSESYFSVDMKTQVKTLWLEINDTIWVVGTDTSIMYCHTNASAVARLSLVFSWSDHTINNHILAYVCFIHSE